MRWSFAVLCAVLFTMSLPETAQADVKLVLTDQYLTFGNEADDTSYIVIGSPKFYWYGGGGDDRLSILWVGGTVNLDVTGGDGDDTFNVTYLGCSGISSLDTDATHYGKPNYVSITNILSSVQTSVVKLVSDPDPVFVKILSPFATLKVQSGTARSGS